MTTTTTTDRLAAVRAGGWELLEGRTTYQLVSRDPARYLATNALPTIEQAVEAAEGLLMAHVAVLAERERRAMGLGAYLRGGQE